jgi:DNA helicase IV
VDEVLGHTRVQFSRRSEQQLSHVDADRLQALDGRSLDAGTPQEAAGTIDVEDYAVCLELLRLKTGGLKTHRGSLSRYRELVIDEAQDLASIELAVLGRALAPGAGLTLCGDEVQQIDPAASFGGWQRALRDLGRDDTQTVRLRTSYRCTAPVTAFAQQVLGPLAPAESPRSSRPGTPVLRSCPPTEGHAVYLLTLALEDLLRREPAAGVAVIASDRQRAARLHGWLDRCLPARLVLAGEFSFSPGVDVTEVAQVKGLEFDVVVIPDATPGCYPDNPQARRRLHVACTRAIHQLWVISVGRPSPLLPSPEQAPGP